MLAVSSAAALFARQSFKIEAEVLPNVFDYELYKNAKPLEKYDDDRLTILFLGRLVQRKGCTLLLQAVAGLKQSSADLGDFRVVICGSGHLRSKLEQFVNANDLADVVEFVGFVNETDKPRYYASADLAVFPSRGGESFGIVLLEAMASPKGAVLAGNNPGYHSVMEPQPDLLFNPRSAVDLKNKLEVYITDTSLRKQKAAWGSQYSAAFDTDEVGKELFNIYTQALLNKQNR